MKQWIRNLRWKLVIKLIPDRLETHEDYEYYKLLTEDSWQHRFFPKGELSWSNCLGNMNDREIEVNCETNSIVIKNGCTF